MEGKDPKRWQELGVRDLSIIESVTWGHFQHHHSSDKSIEWQGRQQWPRELPQE